MIGFFRRVRKKLADDNQFLKYSRYAVGEIVLVVIGILIALQVNNWNETKKEQDKIRKYAESLIQDLENDILMIDTIQFVAREINIRIDSLSNIIRTNELNEISNLDIFCLSWMKLYRPYSWNRATLDELKNSGGLQLIRNSSIAKRINEYEAFARHMDEDYKEDNLISNQAWSLMSSVVDVNYSNSISLREAIRVSAVYGTLDDLFNSSEYEIAKKSQLPLNTDDKTMLVNAVNQYSRLHFNIDIRNRIELPRLIADAEELMHLLREEYQIDN